MTTKLVIAITVAVLAYIVTMWLGWNWHKLKSEGESEAAYRRGYIDGAMSRDRNADAMKLIEEVNALAKAER